MIDLAKQLFPNLLTLMTQLCASGIIYLMYRKYLHKPVIAYLDRQADELAKAQFAKQTLQTETELAHRELIQKRKQVEADIEKLKHEMENSVAQEKQALLTQAQIQADRIEADMRHRLAQKQSALDKQAQQDALVLADKLTRQVLKDIPISEDAYLDLLKQKWQTEHAGS